MRTQKSRTIKATGSFAFVAVAAASIFLADSHTGPDVQLAAGLTALAIAVFLASRAASHLEHRRLERRMAALHDAVHELRAAVAEREAHHQHILREMTTDRMYTRDGIHTLADKVDGLTNLSRIQTDLWRELNDSNPRPVPRA